MILTLLYHRVAEGKYANSLEMMQSHLKHISENYSIVWPGENTRFFELSLCLTFDDGYFDFYHYVFPLLKKYQLKAILAVPTQCIEFTTNKSIEKRLQDSDYCTWSEIQEMHKSGRVKIASHSHSHANMTLKNVDIEKEIQLSKKILEDKLQARIDTFVYPYGKSHPQLQDLLQKYYTWTFRIGSALNTSWKPLLYRIPSDQLLSPKQPFLKRNLLQYFGKYLLNKVRGR